jgi:hypothetical protein
MTRRHLFLRHALRFALAAPAFALCASIVACTGSQGTPQVFASVSLGAYYDPNHNMANTCNSFKSISEVFSIGTATGTCDPKTGLCGNTGPVRVKDGDTQGGGATVNVKCSVTGGFDINLQASLGSRGSLQIFGHVDGTAGGQGVSADIAYAGSDYSANGNCSVAYMYASMPVPQNPPIAPGRIWAHLSCPQMGDPSGVRQVGLMDGMQVPEICDGEVDFIFENCSM